MFGLDVISKYLHTYIIRGINLVLNVTYQELKRLILDEMKSAELIILKYYI